MEKEIKNGVLELINSLEVGETINYWTIADKFDKVKNGETDYKIVEIYDNLLDELEDKGLIEFEKDKDGNDNIIRKIKE